MNSVFSADVVEIFKIRTSMCSVTFTINVFFRTKIFDTSNVTHFGVLMNIWFGYQLQDANPVKKKSMIYFWPHYDAVHFIRNIDEAYLVERLIFVIDFRSISARPNLSQYNICVPVSRVEQSCSQRAYWSTNSNYNDRPPWWFGPSSRDRFPCVVRSRLWPILVHQIREPFWKE